MYWLSILGDLTSCAGVQPSGNGGARCLAASRNEEMPLTKFGFIVAGTGLSAARNRMVMKAVNFEMVAIGVSDASDGPAAARTLVNEGAQLIELCGAFGPIWTAKVIEAIDGKVPVGFVGYGPEAITQMYKLFE